MHREMPLHKNNNHMRSQQAHQKRKTDNFMMLDEDEQGFEEQRQPYRKQVEQIPI